MSAIQPAGLQQDLLRCSRATRTWMLGLVAEIERLQTELDLQKESGAERESRLYQEIERLRAEIDRLKENGPSLRVRLTGKETPRIVAGGDDAVF